MGREKGRGGEGRGKGRGVGQRESDSYKGYFSFPALRSGTKFLTRRGRSLASKLKMMENFGKSMHTTRSWR